MTFEIAFDYRDQAFKAAVTTSGRDFLVNLSSPAQYEAYQTLVFTAHDDETLGYDGKAYGEEEFMEAISKEITDYIHQNHLTF